MIHPLSTPDGSMAFVRYVDWNKTRSGRPLMKFMWFTRGNFVKKCNPAHTRLKRTKIVLISKLNFLKGESLKMPGGIFINKIVVSKTVKIQNF